MKPFPHSDEYGLARFVFLTFRHSQGDETLQSHIFDYTFSIYLTPTFDILSARPLTLKMVQDFMRHNEKNNRWSRHPDFEGQTENAFDSAWRQMETSINAADSGETSSLSSIIATISPTIVSRDVDYVFGFATRRPARPFSFAIYYGIEGHRTGSPVLDQMYKDITPHFDVGKIQEIRLAIARFPK